MRTGAANQISFATLRLFQIVTRQTVHNEYPYSGNVRNLSVITNSYTAVKLEIIGVLARRL